MIDLSTYSGLPVFLDESMKLVFGKGMDPVSPEVRTLEQARGVLWNMTARVPEQLYFMYRDVRRTGDKALLDSHQVRYDITVLVPGEMGGEYVKTVGHYHPEVPGTNTCYPEVYEVLHGRAHYLLQKLDASGLIVTDVVIVEAGPGEKVLIPPGYGHITINPGREPLVMSNMAEYRFKSVYGTMAEARGGAYYEVLEEDDIPVWVENEHYKEVVEPRLVEPREFPELGITKASPLYTAFLKAPQKSDYLVRPQLHEPVMRGALA